MTFRSPTSNRLPGMPSATPTAAHCELVAVRQLGSPVLVMVSRSGRGWSAEVAALGVVRRRRSLAALDRCVRQLLGTGTAEYHFSTGDARLDRLVVQIQTTRNAARRHEERVQRLVEQALRLPSSGSVRDLAVLLGLSHQRIQQLMSTVEGEGESDV